MIIIFITIIINNNCNENNDHLSLYSKYNNNIVKISCSYCKRTKQVFFLNNL